MVSAGTIEKRKTHIRQRGSTRAMRRIPTDAERKFWGRVRNRQLDGCKFERQFLIGPYIADFICLDHKLVVELDGGQHLLQARYNEQRTIFLRAHGFHILRFWNTDVLTDMDGVIETVLRVLRDPLTLPSPPLGERQ